MNIYLRLILLVVMFILAILLFIHVFDLVVDARTIIALMIIYINVGAAFCVIVITSFFILKGKRYTNYADIMAVFSRDAPTWLYVPVLLILASTVGSIGGIFVICKEAWESWIEPIIDFFKDIYHYFVKKKSSH